LNKIKRQERLAKLKEKQKRELNGNSCSMCDWQEIGECGYCAEHCECEE